jgi:hypothetical protein
MNKTRNQPPEMLDHIQYFLMRSGSSSRCEFDLVFPEYTSIDVSAALTHLTQLGRAAVETREGNEVWSWTHARTARPITAASASVRASRPSVIPLA